MNNNLSTGSTGTTNQHDSIGTPRYGSRYGAPLQREPTGQNNTNTELSRNQIYLLELYNLQYNELMQQINLRYREATAIRNNMNTIIAQSYPDINIQNNYQNGYNNTTNNTNNYQNGYNNTTNNTNNTNNTEWNNLLRTFFNTVPICPTPAEITRATRQQIFSQVIEPINNRCPISLEYFGENDQVTQIIYCEHLFNPAQITTWFRSNVICPICRYDIRNYIEDTQENTSNSESKEETIRQETKESEAEDLTGNPVTTVIPTSNADELISQLLLDIISEQLTTNASQNTANPLIDFDASNNLYFMEFLFRY